MRRFLIIIFSFFALSLPAFFFASFCFLVIPFHGGILGAALGAVFITFLILVGDKILLATIQADLLDADHHLVSVVKNLSCHLEMEDVSIFRSAKFRNSLYFLEGPLGKSSVVVGDELLKILSMEELKALLFQSLCMIKKKEGWLRVLANLLFVPFCFLFSGGHKGKSFFLGLFINVLLFPISVLKDCVLRWHGEKVDLSENKEFLSAFFKIRNLEVSSRRDILVDVMKNLSVVQSSDDGLMSSLIDKSVLKQTFLF